MQFACSRSRRQRRRTGAAGPGLRMALGEFDQSTADAEAPVLAVDRELMLARIQEPDDFGAEFRHDDARWIDRQRSRPVRDIAGRFAGQRAFRDGVQLDPRDGAFVASAKPTNDRFRW
jgi:hypothetical protein